METIWTYCNFTDGDFPNLLEGVCPQNYPRWVELLDLITVIPLLIRNLGWTREGLWLDLWQGFCLDLQQRWIREIILGSATSQRFCYFCIVHDKLTITTSEEFSDKRILDNLMRYFKRQESLQNFHESHCQPLSLLRVYDMIGRENQAEA